MSKIPHTLQFCLICRFLRQHTFVLIFKYLFAGSIIEASGGRKFIVERWTIITEYQSDVACRYSTDFYAVCTISVCECICVPIAFWTGFKPSVISPSESCSTVSTPQFSPKQKMSSPPPPCIESLPIPPTITSLSAPPTRRSFPASPKRALLPLFDQMVSLPLPPCVFIQGNIKKLALYALS